MSAVVKLSSKLPADFEMNGVDALAQDLIDDPKLIRAAFVTFDTRNVNVDTDSGSHIPTIRIRRFEPLGDVDAVSKAIRDAVGVAFEDRTGRPPLPLDIVEVTEERFSDTLPEGDES